MSQWMFVNGFIFFTIIAVNFLYVRDIDKASDVLEVQRIGFKAIVYLLSYILIAITVKP